jgi:hypothetical protein
MIFWIAIMYHGLRVRRGFYVSPVKITHDRKLCLERLHDCAKAFGLSHGDGGQMAFGRGRRQPPPPTWF